MDYLTPAERAQLEDRRKVEPFVDETLRQVERILASPTFERVQEKARNFLVFVVTMKLAGKADEIKETTVAIYVFDEPPDFNPAETAKVRMADTMRSKSRSRRPPTYPPFATGVPPSMSPYSRTGIRETSEPTSAWRSVMTSPTC